MISQIAKVLQMTAATEQMVPRQLRVLALASETPPGIDLGEAADIMCVPCSAVTRAADVLAGNGFVKRLPNTEDRRRVYICATREGRQLLEKLDKEIGKGVRAANGEG